MVQYSSGRHGQGGSFGAVLEATLTSILWGTTGTVAARARGSLDFFYVNAAAQNKGIGQRVWALIEQRYPEVQVWETHTPYFDKRNVHFYVNRLGFHIVEFYNEHNPDPNDPSVPERDHDASDQLALDFFRFEKRI